MFIMTISIKLSLMDSIRKEVLNHFKKTKNSSMNYLLDKKYMINLFIYCAIIFHCDDMSIIYFMYEK